MAYFSAMPWNNYYEIILSALTGDVGSTPTRGFTGMMIF